MTFEWVHYLDLARELKEISRQSKSDEEFEARLRSCISRAYYAAFHAASLYLENNMNYVMKKGGNSSHQEVCREFQRNKENDSKLILIGDELYNSCVARNKADYRIPYDSRWRNVEARKLMTEEASKALLRSYKIIKLINSLSEVSSDVIK